MTAVPPYQDLLWPAVLAMRDLGDSGSIDEITERVLERENFSEAQQSALHGDGPGTEIAYRLAWARTYLKGMGLADNSRRGVWSLTAAGRTVTEPEIEPLRQKYIAASRKPRRRKATTDDPAELFDTNPEGASREESWQDQLLDAVMQMEPAAFERLAQRLLREAGFTNTRVTGKSGDGGIDGVGVYRLSLVSFPVFFQCKRYVGSVGAGAVRDFRGAMMGRGDKGLIITTGTFTADAKAHAARDGAPPLDLIDGARLCELLKEFDMGVTTRIRQVEDVSVDSSFFQRI
ncbi:restriction endonuclease [Mycobacterium sp. GA-1841]|uniref:restriction endonuclease n=1 Tax=Mycobacterium sp. GA-1841 TaxID=1834154 RepID=UPI0021100B6F|nr:restriction endonuclease [Mycobacterium sp. GA-1841]